jgi:hypothetical protein
MITPEPCRETAYHNEQQVRANKRYNAKPSLSQNAGACNGRRRRENV